MKNLTCEMCGGSDLIKQDGVFVCQNCGMKYSLEEAKKMMIEGTVDVQGTVKVDNSAFVEGYLQNARRAKEKTDWEEVEKYYNMVERNDPQNIEAVFYSSYGKAMLSLTDANRFTRQQKFDVFGKSISVIDDYYNVEKSEELKPIIEGMSVDLIKMTESKFVYNIDRNMPHGNDADYTRLMFAQVEIRFVESIENIIKKDEKAYLYHILTEHYRRCILNVKVGKKTTDLYIERMTEANKRLVQLDPTCHLQYVPNGVYKTSACYIATAVYGSYDCPQVWTLRRYRDCNLSKTRHGRVFIKTYYRISPTLVKWFGNTEWFKKVWKGRLDHMVATLQSKGVASTPYEDENW